VLQDLNDEPVSILLERIRAEQAVQLTKPKRVSSSRKPTMTKMSKESVKEVIRQLPKDTFSFDELRANIPGNYESLKDIVFALLDEAEPNLKQVFNQEAGAMRFVWGDK
jgi:type I restriction enzyme S subunit